MFLRALIKQDGKQYSALCLELDVAAHGNNPAEARENLEQAVRLYLQGFENDELGRAVCVISCDIWQEFFAKEDAGRKPSNISFYSIITKEDGSRVIEKPASLV